MANYDKIKKTDALNTLIDLSNKYLEDFGVEFKGEDGEMHKQIQMSSELKQKTLPRIKDIEFVGQKVISFATLQLLDVNNVSNISAGKEQGGIFYGKFLIRTIKQIDMTNPAIMAVGFKRTQLYLYINPFMIGTMCTSYDQIITILKHEMLHVTYQHLNRYADIMKLGENYRLATNYATDCAINQHLDNLIDGVITLDYMRERFGSDLKANMDSQYYYDKIKDQFTNQNNNDDGNGNQQNNNQQGNDGNQQQNNQGNGQSSRSASEDSSQNASSSSSQKVNKVDGQSNSASKNKAKDKQVKDEHNTWEDGNSEDNAEYTKNFLKGVYDDMTEKERGTLPASIQAIFDELLKPSKRNWKQVLSKFVGSISVPYKYTKKRPNRRMPYRSDLPGRVMNKVIKITIAVDTSGSMSNQTLAYIGRELGAILKGYTLDITYIQCDAKVQSVQKIKRLNDLKLDFKGRGGTCFQPVFDYMHEQHANNNEDLLIYFTDGWGESELESNFGLNKVLWVIVDGDSSNLSLSNAPGIVTSLQDDKGFEKFHKVNN